MSDDQTETAPQADGGHGLATALIVLTTLMLLLAFVATEKILGDRYNEGIFASK